MRKEPEISVIISLYNKEKSIKRCVDSVLQQSYQNWELIVVNDGSSDNSLTLVANYKDERIRLINQLNGGVSSARNRGTQESKGKYVLYLDADDVLLPVCLETLYSLVIKYNVNVATANLIVESPRNTNNSPLINGFPERIIENNFKSHSLGEICPRCGATLIERKTALKYPFRIELCRFEDAESLFDILRNEQIAYSPVCVMIYKNDFSYLSKKKNALQSDFIAHLNFKGKGYWEKINLGGLLYNGFRAYPDQKIYFLSKYKYNCLYVLLYCTLRARVKYIKKKNVK